MLNYFFKIKNKAIRSKIEDVLNEEREIMHSYIALKQELSRLKTAS